MTSYNIILADTFLDDVVMVSFGPYGPHDLIPVDDKPPDVGVNFGLVQVGLSRSCYQLFLDFSLSVYTYRN